MLRTLLLKSLTLCNPGIAKEWLILVTDGGDTDGLSMDVNTAMPDEALETRQELLNESPYLSDTVMKQAIYQENVLPNAMIRDVLVANPQSAKSVEMMNMLDMRLYPMPQYMKDEILQGKNILSAKDQIESQISMQKLKIANAYKQLV